METVLIFRIGSLGDTVVALPCFHLIARAFPTSRRIVITDTPTSGKVTPLEYVLGNTGLIDNVIYFPPTNRKLRDLLDLRAKIRKTNCRTLIYIADRDLIRTLRDICFFRLCGIRRIIGAPLTRDLSRPRIDPATGRAEREAERLVRCLQPLGTIDLSDPASWDLRLLPGEIHAADRHLENLNGAGYLAISIGGKEPSKDWGDNNWFDLLRLMATNLSKYALVFFGSSDEFDRCNRIAATWPGLILNMCGKLSPRESAAAMRRAALFIGHDNGPMHLAAAVNVPCVCMFGNFNIPAVWHPMGPRHRITHNMRGVLEISAEQIYADVCKVLAEQPVGVTASTTSASKSN